MDENVQITPLMWDEIMKNSPTMKALFEWKLNNELQKNQVEINMLKEEKTKLEQDQISTLEAVAELYEMMLGGAV